MIAEPARERMYNEQPENQRQILVWDLIIYPCVRYNRTATIP